MKRLPLREYLTDILFDLVGSLLFATGVNLFTLPNHIAPGGVTGISTICNHLFAIPVGLTSLLVNLPLLLIAWRKIGAGFALRTLKTVLIVSTVLDLQAAFGLSYTGDPLLASLFGGLLIGAGLALVFMRGSTTGGSDIVSRLVRLRWPHLQMGRVLMLADLAVILLAALVFRQLETALYGIIVVYTTGRTVDAILYGMDQGRMVLIVTNCEKEISRSILTELSRGVTVLDGRGAFSDQPRPVLLCAVRKTQFYALKRIVRTIDPSAFLIVTEAGEIVGQGFKPNLPEN